MAESQCRDIHRKGGAMKLQKNSAPPAATVSAQNSECSLESFATLPLAERQAYFASHDIRVERGEYLGDGIPRDFGGNAYEPLSWNDIQIFGRV